ncbi:MAG TPA: histidine kinase, partial [Pseudomonas sp.]|nr:histidine kinase [Pseudomonas sp.]
AIAAFVAEQGDLVARMSQMLATQRWDEGQALAHRLHGAASNLALMHLSGLGRAIDQAFEARDEHRLRELLGELEQALQAVVERVPLVPEHGRAAEAASVDLGLLSELAAQLRIALERGSLDDTALASMERAARGTVCAGIVNDLRQALDDFDFDQALLLLDQLSLRLQGEEIT